MPKMCPYNRAREVQRYKQKNELDESGNISSYAYEMRVDFIPLPCTGEECGAWRDGACRYASGKNFLKFNSTRPTLRRRAFCYAQNAVTA